MFAHTRATRVATSSTVALPVSVPTKRRKGVSGPAQGVRRPAKRAGSLLTMSRVRSGARWCLQAASRGAGDKPVSKPGP